MNLPSSDADRVDLRGSKPGVSACGSGGEPPGTTLQSSAANEPASLTLLTPLRAQYHSHTVESSRHRDRPQAMPEDTGEC